MLAVRLASLDVSLQLSWASLAISVSVLCMSKKTKQQQQQQQQIYYPQRVQYLKMQQTQKLVNLMSIKDQVQKNRNLKQISNISY